MLIDGVINENNLRDFRRRGLRFRQDGLCFGRCCSGGLLSYCAVCYGIRCKVFVGRRGVLAGGFGCNRGFNCQCLICVDAGVCNLVIGLCGRACRRHRRRRRGRIAG